MIDYDAHDYDTIRRDHTRAKRALLQAEQDEAVRQGRTPWRTRAAFTLYVGQPSKVASASVKVSDLGAALASPPPRLWSCRPDPEDEWTERQDPDPVKLAASDAAWERAKAQEPSCYLCQSDEPSDESDNEPQGGAERRSKPAAREIKLGAELEGGEVSLEVPSDSSDATHLVTCRQMRGNGVVVYAATSCTCEDFLYRKSKTSRVAGQLPQPCKHMKRAERFAREQALKKLMDEGAWKVK